MKNNEWIDVLEPLKQMFELKNWEEIDKDYKGVYYRANNYEPELINTIYMDSLTKFLTADFKKYINFYNHFYLEDDPNDEKIYSYNFGMSNIDFFTNYWQILFKEQASYFCKNLSLDENSKEINKILLFKKFCETFLIPATFTSNQFSFEKKGTIFIFSNNYEEFGVKIKIENNKIIKVKYEIPINNVTLWGFSSFVIDNKIVSLNNSFIIKKYGDKWLQSHNEKNNS